MGLDLMRASRLWARFTEGMLAKALQDAKLGDGRFPTVRPDVGLGDHRAVSSVPVRPEGQFHSQLCPGGVSLDERVVEIEDSVLSELRVQCAMGCRRARQHDHATCVAVESMYDPEWPERRLQNFQEVGSGLMSTRYCSQPGWFVCGQQRGV